MYAIYAYTLYYKYITENQNWLLYIYKKTIYGETRDKKEQKNNIEWSREKNPGTTKWINENLIMSFYCIKSDLYLWYIWISKVVVECNINISDIAYHKVLTSTQINIILFGILCHFFLEFSLWECCQRIELYMENYISKIWDYWDWHNIKENEKNWRQK